MRFAASFFVLLLVQASVPAAAQNINIQGVARSVSLFTAVAKYCPAIPPETARKYVMAFFDVGTKSFGKERFERRLASEIPRRMQEVENAGPRRWCRNQLSRPLMQKLIERQ